MKRCSDGDSRSARTRARSGAAAAAGKARRGSRLRPEPHDPAEELRAKLIESKAAATVDEEAEAEEPVAATDGNGTPIDPEVRRRAVHERARASIDDLSD